ncbi:MAG: prepilin peptidase [Pseudomonadota bacterium]
MSAADGLAMLDRAAAAPDIALIAAAALGILLACSGPLPHAARAILRLGLGRGRAGQVRALTPAATLGLRAASLLAPAAGWLIAGAPGAIFTSVAAASLLLAILDLSWRWLPLEWVGGIAASGIVLAMASGALLEALTETAAIMLLLAALAATFRRLRGVDGLGLGDVFLAGAITTHLGLAATAMVLFAAAIAALAAEALIFRDIYATRYRARTVPLGAWLALCFVCAPLAGMFV